MIRQHLDTLTVTAPRQGLHEISDAVEGWLETSGIATGLLTLFCKHSSASLLIQENAAPAAKRDLEATAMAVPEDQRLNRISDVLGLEEEDDAEVKARGGKGWGVASEHKTERFGVNNPRLKSKPENMKQPTTVETAEDKPNCAPVPGSANRSNDFARTKHNPREAAFAEAWEKANELANYENIKPLGDGGYGSGNCYGGDILQALAQIVGVKVESV